MDRRLDLERVPTARPHFAALHASLADAFDHGELERGDLYEEIAERRAHLECAETLRRARAL